MTKRRPHPRENSGTVQSIERALSLLEALGDSRGEVEAALGISAPTTRLTPRRMEGLIPVMLRTGREVSAQLGFSGPLR